ncbi:MAG: DUF4388 domain-containing protein [Ktedonobacteraceae bacterium]
MTKGRDIAAESIGDLLEVARLQRRNGMLRAECSQRGYLEEGEIYLQGGEPIYAYTDMLTGTEALHYLLSWRNIYFAFVSSVPQPPANIVASVRTNRVSAPTQVPTTPAPPMRVPAPQGPRWSLAGERTATMTPPKYTSTPGMAWLVPQKARPRQDALTQPLSRRQRVIYFLIDGQRTIGDLARTTGKTVTDVELILGELREQGLIIM